MPEILYSSSPISTILSAIALLLTFLIPYMLGQKVRIKQFPKPIYQLLLICVHWNTGSLIGNMFFSGPNIGIGAKITFGLQAIAWVQLGNAVYHICEQNLTIKRSNFWRLLNAIGGASAIAVAVIFCIKPSIITDFSVFGMKPFHRYPFFISYSILFFLFVFPETMLSLYKMLRSSMQTSDKDAAQIRFYMVASFIFFVVISFFMDFLIPISFSFNVDGHFPVFLQWHQYSTVILTILCCQYFTSISFKNKSSHWLLKNLEAQLSDSTIHFLPDGKIVDSNPAAQLLFKKSESEMNLCRIQDLIPDIKYDIEIREETKDVVINDERHTFFISLFKVRVTLTTYMWMILLSDQSNSLIYRQRIESYNKQFADYKQDLIRYQDRLDSSEKKFKEQNNLSLALINALPFQFWSKNEQGVYMTQNITDIKHRGNQIQTTDNSDKISSYEKQARELGIPSIYTSYEDEDHNEISEEEANNRIHNHKTIFIYRNQFIPIIANQKPYKIIGLKQDLTEQRRLERERDLLREQKNIHSRLEELGTMCGAFAHDYKNILGSQIGFSELAQEILVSIPEDAVPKKEYEKLGKVNSFIAEATKAANRAKDSLNEMLNALREKTTTAPEAMVFSPFLIIEDVVKKLQLTLPSNIHISTEIVDPDLKISGLPAALDRILTNLANNAIFAMKSTGGTLTFRLERETLKNTLVLPFSDAIEKGTYAKFTIADTGTGMDSGTLERIFSPFFTTKAPGEGLGLGLSSALRLLKEGKAHFTVQTTLGEGTKFNLYWDIANDQPENASCPPS